MTTRLKLIPATTTHHTGCNRQWQPNNQILGINKLGTLLSSQTTGASDTQLDPPSRRFAPEQLLHLSRPTRECQLDVLKSFTIRPWQTRINLTTTNPVPVKPNRWQQHCQPDPPGLTPAGTHQKASTTPDTNRTDTPGDQLFKNTPSLPKGNDRDADVNTANNRLFLVFSTETVVLTPTLRTDPFRASARERTLHTSPPTRKIGAESGTCHPGFRVIPRVLAGPGTVCAGTRTPT